MATELEQLLDLLHRTETEHLTHAQDEVQSLMRRALTAALSRERGKRRASLSQALKMIDRAAQVTQTPPGQVWNIISQAVHDRVLNADDLTALTNPGLKLNDSTELRLKAVKRQREEMNDYWGKENKRFRNDAARAVREVIRRGGTADDLASTLQERLGVHSSRALLIAQDQLGKAAARAEQERLTQLGLKEYIWRTMGDGKVRPEHRARNGKTYPLKGGTEKPGQAIRCRCRAVPVKVHEAIEAAPRSIPSGAEAWVEHMLRQELEGATGYQAERIQKALERRGGLVWDKMLDRYEAEGRPPLPATSSVEAPAKQAPQGEAAHQSAGGWAVKLRQAHADTKTYFDAQLTALGQQITALQERNLTLYYENGMVDDLPEMKENDARIDELLKETNVVRGILGDTQGQTFTLKRLELAGLFTPNSRLKLSYIDAGEVNALGRKPNYDAGAMFDAARQFIDLPVKGTVELNSVRSGARAYCYGAEIALDRDIPDFPVAIHELGHWLERHSPELAEDVRKFLSYRTRGKKLARFTVTGMESEDPYYEGAFDWPDVEHLDTRLAGQYVSKKYDHDATEVTSVGLEYMIRAPHVLAEIDPEFFEFIRKTVMRGERWHEPQKS